MRCSEPVTSALASFLQLQLKLPGLVRGEGCEAAETTGQKEATAGIHQER